MFFPLRENVRNFALRFSYNKKSFQQTITATKVHDGSLKTRLVTLEGEEGADAQGLLKNENINATSKLKQNKNAVQL